MEQIPVGTRSRIKYNGPFDGNQWYRLLYDLFITWGFEVDEKVYREVHSPGGGSKDVFITWEAKKYPKGDTYAQFKIVVNINIIAMKKIKVVRDGQEIKTDYGDNDCYYYGYVVLDPDDKWQRHPLLRYLRAIYDRFFYRDKIEFYKNLCYEDMYTITNEIKAYFNLARFM